MKTMVAVTLMAILAGVARGEWIVNSPYEPVGGSLAASGQQKIGLQFTIAAPMVVRSIEGRLFAWPEQPGEALAAIYSNGPNGLPDQRLFEESFFVPETPRAQFSNDNRQFGAEWRGVYDRDYQLAAGTYWAVFEANNSPTLSLGIEVSAVTPPVNQIALFDFVDFEPIQWQWRVPQFTTYSPGIRVSGHLVPEPAMALPALWFVLYASLARRN
jgi:hypothetical protein